MIQPVYPNKKLVTRVQESISGIPPEQWNALTQGNPFLTHQFFTALHETECAHEKTGWTPQFITLWEEENFVGAMPLYLKTHSYGEYVFDWAWANAYQQHGLAYYPKLVCAVPFTPVTGPRLLTKVERYGIHLVQEAIKLVNVLDASSLHCLFPGEERLDIFQQQGMLLRKSVQFHWTNRPYQDFEEFLSTMNHNKRKKIKQERKKLRETNVTFEWLTGSDIDDRHWEFFYRCYCHTYLNHYSKPYLTLDFFKSIGRSLSNNIVLMIASRDHVAIASSLYIRGADTLYGRYWGALEYHPGLHFEACYYQGIEFCVSSGLTYFEGGAQGEHKLARGLLPAPTYSVHWLTHPEFSNAIEKFLDRETASVEEYIDELHERSPYKKIVTPET